MNANSEYRHLGKLHTAGHLTCKQLYQAAASIDVRFHSIGYRDQIVVARRFLSSDGFSVDLPYGNLLGPNEGAAMREALVRSIDRCVGSATSQAELNAVFNVNRTNLNFDQPDLDYGQPLPAYVASSAHYAMAAPLGAQVVLWFNSEKVGFGLAAACLDSLVADMFARGIPLEIVAKIVSQLGESNAEVDVGEDSARAKLFGIA